MTQDRLNRQAVAYLADLRAAAAMLWAKACEFDSIPPESSFVVFSDGNRFAQFYNIALTQYFEARQAYADGGYVGLSIRHRN